MSRRQSTEYQLQAAEAERLMEHPAMLRAFEMTHEAILREMDKDILNQERSHHLRLQLINLKLVKQNLTNQVQLALVEDLKRQQVGVVR